MIKMYTARTSEIDEIEEAVGEIKSQINLGALKKYSGGVIFCHTDFVDSGVVAALCGEMPFPVVGMSSMASANESGYGRYDLTLTVLTSDDVSFEASMTEGVTHENYTTETGRLFDDLRGRVSDDPKVIIAFMPYIRDVAGFELVESMDAACHGLPLWGSLSSGSADFNYDTVWTICNGKALRSGVAMMFVNGPVEPKFIVSSIPERNITSSRAIITKSEGAVLREVNGMPLLKYLAEIGLDITNENITTTPMMLYYPGAQKPVALGFYTLFEDGSVLAGGPMPVGTQISAGNIDSAGIIESAESGLNQILEDSDRQATLLLPCITRYIMLSPDQEGELRMIRDRLSESGSPFVMGYSGGELCPIADEDGKLHNRFHNYTFCACLL